MRVGLPSDNDNLHWGVAGYSVGKVNRSRKTNTADETIIDIGALRALKDCVADVPASVIKEYRDTVGPITKQEHVDEIRRKAGMDMIPLLIIYRIDKDSKVFGKHDKDTRADLDMPCDIIGIQICVPGEQINTSFRRSLTIKLPDKDKEDEVEESA